MKDARYLIRLANERSHTPLEQAELLQEVRTRVAPHHAKAINLRVSPTAIEFDLFIATGADIQTCLPDLNSVGALLTCKSLDLPPGSTHPQAIVTEARHLFNEQRFWEVHEVLEGLWKELKGQEKELVQGLIIAAAALVHVQKNEPNPVWRMMNDALRRLENPPATYYGWEILKFRDHWARAAAAKKIEIPTV